MIKNFDTEVKDIYSETMFYKAGIPLKMSHVILESLLGTNQNDQPEAVEKFNRYQLAVKIQKGGDVDLSVDECAKIKEMVGKYSTTYFVGKVFEAIEEKPKTASAK